MALKILERIDNCAVDACVKRELQREIAGLLEALVDIEELVDGYVDIDANGGPNLAMRVLTVVHIALGKS